METVVEPVVEPKVEPEVGPVAEPKVEPEPTRQEARFKNDLVKFKQEAKTLKEENDALKKESQEREVDSLRKKEEYKTLSEQFEARAIKAEEKNENDYSMYMGDRKRLAIETEAIKLGIKPAYMKFLNAESSDDMEIEITSIGNVNILGAKAFVEDFKSRHGDLFDGKAAPFINGANPKVIDPTTLSSKDLLALQKTDKVKYNEEIKKRLEARRK